jgi:hypothetical protein
LIFNLLQAGQAYPCKELGRLREPALRALVPRLMAEEPPSRPPAAALQAEPFFASDAVDEWGRLAVSDRASSQSCRRELLDAGAAALGVPSLAATIAEVSQDG